MHHLLLNPNPSTDPPSNFFIHPGDVEVTVLGCATERKLRIFSMAGDCILERTHQELKAYNRAPRLGGWEASDGIFGGFMDQTIIDLRCLNEHI